MVKVFSAETRTVECVTRAFSDAGVLVHAYLICEFTDQTVGDTVDFWLELVNAFDVD